MGQSSLDQADLQRFARLLEGSSNSVAFTGAGVSTESGIPDFRSPGGIWSKFRNVLYQEFLADPAARKEYWEQKVAGEEEFGNALPNAAHQVLAKWEKLGRLRGVITQNIDELHQQAGSKNVLELHGTARKIGCLDCQRRFANGPLVASFRATGEPPHCPECGGLLKHATISFGQALPAEVLQTSVDWTRHCELFLVVGSSLVVEPAASLPRLARAAGAALVIVNRDPTPLDDQATLVLRGSAGALLAGVDSLLAERQAD